jgi:uncharacterized protein (DUF58 family)
MITRAGWLLLIAGGGLLFAGRAIGTIELFVAGATVLALVAASWTYVRLAQVRLRVARTLTPTRVHAGDNARVEVSAANSGGSRTPVLRLRDPVDGTRGALLNLAPLRKGDIARAAYRLPTRQRGLVTIGPLAVEISDPFGLARRAAIAAPLVDLTVYPAVDDIALPSGGGDHDPNGGATHRNALGRQGDDFYALRPYVVGDDLRRVHWPSTARRDDLVVRQDEQPWHDRVSVVLDVRKVAHTPASFERAVSAGASVVSAAWRRRTTLHVLTTDGVDTGAEGGLAAVDAVLTYLATVQPSAPGSLRSLLDQLSRAHTGGLLVVVLGRTTASEIEALARLGRAYRPLVAVVTEGSVPQARVKAGAVRLIDATHDGGFGAAWQATFGAVRLTVPA